MGGISGPWWPGITRPQPLAPLGLGGLFIGLRRGFVDANEAQQALTCTTTTGTWPVPFTVDGPAPNSSPSLPPSEDADPRLWLRRRVAEVCFRV